MKSLSFNLPAWSSLLCLKFLDSVHRIVKYIDGIKLLYLARNFTVTVTIKITALMPTLDKENRPLSITENKCL